MRTAVFLIILFTTIVQAQLHFVKTVTITTTVEGGSARPEVVATADRVYVLYLGNIASGNSRTFNLKIYDGNLDTVITSKLLVSTTPEFGGPTDIRIASDREHLYAFYETHKSTSPKNNVECRIMNIQCRINKTQVGDSSSRRPFGMERNRKYDLGERLIKFAIRKNKITGNEKTVT